MLGVRRFHAGWNFDQVLAEALTINKTCSPIAAYDYVESWVTQAYELHQKNVKTGFYTEIIKNGLETPLIFKNEDFDLVAQKIKQDHRFVTVRENDDIWYYSTNEGIYKPLGETIIKEECQKLIEKCKKNTVSEVIETIRRDKTYVYMQDLLESKLINVQNCILDPHNFQLKPHSPEYLTISKLPFKVDPKARNLKLWNHILTIIDPKDINLVIELLWIVISWNNPFKKMFVFKGESNTQKSALADIIALIVGANNVSRQHPDSFLSKGSRFDTSKFIGKRINIASEIGNFTKDQLEKQKALVGAEKQNTERKNDNAEYVFDPVKFVFLYTTNKLGEIYTSINDNSVITRFQFLIFRNKIEDSKANGDWLNLFFEDDNDRQTAVSTIINIILNYKKAQDQKMIPKTRFSTIEETKLILKEQMPPEDKYFEDERIVRREGARLTLEEIRKDFLLFIHKTNPDYKISPESLGHILKRNGLVSKYSNGQTLFKGWAFNTVKGQENLKNLR